MDFILVSRDMKEQAKAHAGSYANKDKMVVLIDEDKIEKMAEDEEYRKKYEDIIGNAGSQLSQMKDTLGSLVGNVKTYGIKVDDNGNTSFFAVVDKSLSAQKERIEKQAKQKTADRKENQAKAAKERLEKAGEERKTGVTGGNKAEASDRSNVETISASSVEELAKKLQDRYYEGLSDLVRTEQEQKMGTQIDFKL